MLYYADDILVYKPICSLDDQCDLNAITNWLVQNSTTLKTVKCKYMLLSRKRSGLASLPACPQLFTVSPSATIMEKVTCMKCFGST